MPANICDLGCVDSSSQFLGRVKEIPNLLLGNGFSLSHPVLGDAFDRNYEQLTSEIVASIPRVLDKLKNFKGWLEPYKAIWSDNQDQCILGHLITKLFERMSPQGPQTLKLLQKGYSEIRKTYSCTRLLSSRKHIFTLNYDPILYLEMLKQGAKFADGFHKPAHFLAQEQIVQRLIYMDGHTKLFYLHGSWFIQENKANGALSKLGFGAHSQDSAADLYAKDGFAPFFILKGESYAKEQMIRCNPYFKYGYDTLGCIDQPLLIFGCSFERDDRILEILAKNEKLQEIYITHIQGDDGPRNKISKIFAKSKAKITFITIGTNVIWENTRGT